MQPGTSSFILCALFLSTPSPPFSFHYDSARLLSAFYWVRALCPHPPQRGYYYSNYISNKLSCHRGPSTVDVHVPPVLMSGDTLREQKERKSLKMTGGQNLFSCFFSGKAVNQYPAVACMQPHSPHTAKSSFMECRSFSFGDEASFPLLHFKI